MAVVNAATLEALWVSFNTIFQQTLERTKTRIDDIASAVPSSTRIEHYPVAALTGRMREWVKDRVIQDLAAFEASVRNLTFEHTIGVPREDIEDDVTGRLRAGDPAAGRARRARAVAAGAGRARRRRVRRVGRLRRRAVLLRLARLAGDEGRRRRAAVEPDDGLPDGPGGLRGHQGDEHVRRAGRHRAPGPADALPLLAGARAGRGPALQRAAGQLQRRSARRSTGNSRRRTRSRCRCGPATSG